MKIAVIDDEIYSREELIHQIREAEPQSEIRQAASGVEAIALLESDSFDVLFVDIHLGDILGTTIASLTQRLAPDTRVVFASAFSEYGVKAFELGVDDYILKPFDPARVREALLRCRPGQPATRDRPPGVRKVAAVHNRRTTLLDPEDVIYIETAGNGRQCILHTQDNTYITSTSLGEYEKELAASGFFRIHKACLVQLKLIQDIFPWYSSGFGLRMLGCDEVLPIGRERIKQLRLQLNL